MPVVSTLGFILNGLIILVINNRHNQIEHFKGDRLFDLIFMVSVFNMADCFISALSIMNICIGFNSIYCSPLTTNLDFQLINRYVIQYLDESIKTCSILASLIFSLERYLNTSQFENRFIKWFKSAKMSHLFAITLVASFLTSLPKICEGEISDSNVVGVSFFLVFYGYNLGWISV